MGKLQSGIQGLIVEHVDSRGIDGAHVAKRLIEAGLQLLDIEGEIDTTSRIQPLIEAGELDYDGSFCINKFREAPASVTPIEDRRVLIGKQAYSYEELEDIVTWTVQAVYVFDRYATLHLAKETPDYAKAARNLSLARNGAALVCCVELVGRGGDIYGYDATVLQEQLERLADAALPVKVAEVTGNIAESELAARYIDEKIAGAQRIVTNAPSQERKEQYETVQLVLCEIANELRAGFHLPEVVIEGKVIPYNESLSTGVSHADALRAFFVDVHERNVRAGWWTDIETGEPKKRNVGELLMLMVTELWEAGNAYARDEADDKLTHRPGLGVELGDTLIRIADLAGALLAGRVTTFCEGLSNPGQTLFCRVGEVADQYEAIRKTPAAAGEPEHGDPIEPMDVAVMVDEKLAYNATRADHKIENRLKADGKRT